MAGIFGIAAFLNWVIAGFVLLFLELQLPGVFLFWFGLAALATGASTAVLGLFFPVSDLWEIQILVFIVYSFVAVIAAKYYFIREKQSDTPFLNDTVAGLTGRTFILTEPIENYQGTIRIHDTLWKISGADTPKGQKIRLIAYKNGVFKVERAD